MTQNAELIEVFAHFIKAHLSTANIPNKGQLVQDIDDFLYQAKIKFDPHPLFQDARQKQRLYPGLEAMDIPTAEGISG